MWPLLACGGPCLLQLKHHLHHRRRPSSILHQLSKSTIPFHHRHGCFIVSATSCITEFGYCECPLEIEPRSLADERSHSSSPLELPAAEQQHVQRYAALVGSSRAGKAYLQIASMSSNLILTPAWRPGSHMPLSSSLTRYYHGLCLRRGR